MLGVTQEMVDQLTDAADAEACRMLSQVQARCELLVAEARVKARNMVNEAWTRAETMLHDTRTKAENRERQSRERAAWLEQDVKRKHTENLDALSREKNRLQNNIDKLRAFEQEHRTHITTYAQSQLQKLVESASDIPVNPARTQQALQGPAALRVGARESRASLRPHRKGRGQTRRLR